MALPQISLQLIRALVPLAEMFNYVSTLRSMSKGRAQYTMQVGDAERICVWVGPHYGDPLGVRASQNTVLQPAVGCNDRVCLSLPIRPTPASYFPVPQLENYQVVPRHIQDTIVASIKGEKAAA